MVGNLEGRRGRRKFPYTFLIQKKEKEQRKRKKGRKLEAKEKASKRGRR